MNHVSNKKSEEKRRKAANAGEAVMSVKAVKKCWDFKKRDSYSETTISSFVMHTYNITHLKLYIPQVQHSGFEQSESDNEIDLQKCFTCTFQHGDVKDMNNYI